MGLSGANACGVGTGGVMTGFEPAVNVGVGAVLWFWVSPGRLTLKLQPAVTNTIKRITTSNFFLFMVFSIHPAKNTLINLFAAARTVRAVWQLTSAEAIL